MMLISFILQFHLFRHVTGFHRSHHIFFLNLIIIHIPYGALVITLSISILAPTPALFFAETRNRYSFPSSRFGTRHDVSSVSTCFLHLVPYLSFISTTYPVILSPPSDEGGAHESSTDSAVMLEILGALGALGVSIMNIKQNNNYIITKILQVSIMSSFVPFIFCLGS